MGPIEHLRSATSLLVVTANLLFWIFPLVLVSVVKLVVPGAWRPADRLLDAIYRAAVRVDDLWLRRVVGLRWDRPDAGVRPDEVCLVLSNHVSWADVLVLQSVISRE